MATVVIDDDVAKQMLAMLHSKLGTDPEYPGFQPDKIATISYFLSEGTGNLNYAKNVMRTYPLHGARLMEHAQRPMQLINITLTLTNEEQMLFRCDYEPEADGIKKYRCVYTDGDDDAWAYIFKSVSLNLKTSVKSAICQIVGVYVDTGSVEWPRFFGGYRKRKTGNNRRKRQAKTRKARRF